MKEKKYHIFRKNVTLSVLLDILNRKKITMLSPMNWPDKNDSFVLDEYRKKKGAEHVYATCFSIDTDSVYHWNSFSNGSEGCRIEIKAQKFLERINSYQKIVHGEVKYLPVDFSKKIPLDQWPFVKRKQFACEHEYRLVLLTDNPEPYEIDLDPQLIDRISLSDSMPKSVAESVKEIIHKLCPNINVYCSTLNDNKQWQKHFK
jgi:hypothetical protein